jgi:hypothetical protein
MLIRLLGPLHAGGDRLRRKWAADRLEEQSSALIRDM